MTAAAGLHWLALTSSPQETSRWALAYGIPRERVTHVANLFMLARALPRLDVAALAVHRSRPFYARLDAQAVEDAVNRRLARVGRPRLPAFDRETMAASDSCPHDDPCGCPA